MKRNSRSVEDLLEKLEKDMRYVHDKNMEVYSILEYIANFLLCIAGEKLDEGDAVRLVRKINRAKGIIGIESED